MIVEGVAEQQRGVIKIGNPLVDIQKLRDERGDEFWRWPIAPWNPFAQISTVDGDDLNVKFIQDRKEAKVRQDLYRSRFGSYDF